MIISIFVIEENTNKKLFRSSYPMTSSQMNYYLTEFKSLVVSGEGFVEKETYNLLYMSSETRTFGMQITKEHSLKNANSILKFIIQNSNEDLYDVLIVIDNTIYGGIGLQLEMKQIVEMDSQEEKIHKMMLENKRMEMAEKEKEYKMNTMRMRELSIQQEEKSVVPVQEHKPKKQETSEKPVLFIIREKLNIKIDKENKIKENTVNGEVVMVISDAKFKNVEVKMKNLKSSFKYSPYLDKNALKKSTLRFERERGINKNIPVLKWTGTRQTLPLSFEFWNDEDDEKFINMIDMKSQIKMKNIEIKFNKENVTDIEIDAEHELEENKIVWKAGKMKKEENKSVEIKCSAFDKDCLFPINVDFSSSAIEISMDVDKMFLEQQEITEFEVRKLVEIESFEILAE